MSELQKKRQSINLFDHSVVLQINRRVPLGLMELHQQVVLIDLDPSMDAEH